MEFIKRMSLSDKVIIFCGKKARADDLSSAINFQNIPVQSNHSDCDQQDSVQALADIKSSNVSILFATDVASLGMDIKDVTHVVNYDFPRNIEEYVQRVGRTCRVGRTLMSLSYVTRSDWESAEELIGVLEKADQEVPEELRNMKERFNAMKARKDRDKSQMGDKRNVISKNSNGKNKKEILYEFPISVEYGITIFERHFRKEGDKYILGDIPQSEFPSFMLGMFAFIPGFDKQLTIFFNMEKEKHVTYKWHNLYEARTNNLKYITDENIRLKYANNFIILPKDIKMIQTLLIISLLCANKKFRNDKHRTEFISKRKDALKMLTHFNILCFPTLSEKYVNQLFDFFNHCIVLKKEIYLYLFKLQDSQWGNCIYYLKDLTKYANMNSYRFIKNFLSHSKAHSDAQLVTEIESFLKEEDKLKESESKEELCYYKLLNPHSSIMDMSSYPTLKYCAIKHMKLTASGRKCKKYKHKGIPDKQKYNILVKKNIKTIAPMSISDVSEECLKMMSITREDAEKLIKLFNKHTATNPV